MAINADPSVRVHVKCNDLEWSDSPVEGVQRKRLHHSGPAESGRVTSLVRFLPGARFPEHPHPQGEEILVIDGTFSDATGDYVAPAYLLNPEGFSHAPWSEAGCLLFVKLRQYAGRERIATTVNESRWTENTTRGVSSLVLQPATGTDEPATRLVRLAAGATLPPTSCAGGIEYFVLDGEFEDDEGRYGRHEWLRLPPGTRHRARSGQGALLYVKMNAVFSPDREQ